MARIHGKNGQVYVGISTAVAAAEPLVNSKKWSANFNTNRIDCTAFGDTNLVYVQGLPDASFQFEGYWDTTSLQTYTAATDGIARKVYLYPSTPSTAGPYWFGTAFLDFTVETPVDGVVAIKATGAPATGFTRVG